MAHQAFCAAAEHQCVPVSYLRACENAYHKEAQKLREAIEENKELQALYEEEGLIERLLWGGVLTNNGNGHQIRICVMFTSTWTHFPSAGLQVTGNCPHLMYFSSFGDGL